jgi:hypothetical protein
VWLRVGVSGNPIPALAGLATGKILATNSLSVGGVLTVGPGTFAEGNPGDLCVAGGASTGAIYFDTSGTRYLYNSGATFTLFACPLECPDATSSTSTTSGSGTFGGGLGVAGNINAVGTIKGNDITAARIQLGGPILRVRSKYIR